MMRAKTPFLGNHASAFFLGENMRDFGILPEKGSQIKHKLLTSSSKEKSKKHWEILIRQ
jgi:hypothetical protein